MQDPSYPGVNSQNDTIGNQRKLNSKWQTFQNPMEKQFDSNVNKNPNETEENVYENMRNNYINS